MADTVAALSSGLVPSGVAVIRISGPSVRFALERITGGVTQARLATLRAFKDPATGKTLDKGLVLFFPKPNSFTGEDVAELHAHGGRAVVSALLQALWSLDGIVPAEAGDFTRQAFLNGKLDLTQVEAVGDLIHASTAWQLDQALDQLEGAASRKLGAWKDVIADARAMIEADLDFSDEDDVPGSVVDSLPEQLQRLLKEMEMELSSSVAERLRDGFRVVLAGAPNSGKSTLLNKLLQRDAALVSPVAGTTRDQIDVPIDLDGLPVILSDTAGIRSDNNSSDPIESMGIEKTRVAVEGADCVVWLLGGDESAKSVQNNETGKTIRVRSKSDIEDPDGTLTRDVDLQVSGKTGAGLDSLKSAIADRLRDRYSMESETGKARGSLVLDARRRIAVHSARTSLEEALGRLSEGALSLDHAAEELRLAQRALGSITGDVNAEQVLDRVFSRFCIGK
ncbi:MAG: tRNA uridine-5-carboxymethylaminomethyl(34) synthesis GTPase MnmE [Hyphomicrobiales bacterium]